MKMTLTLFIGMFFLSYLAFSQTNPSAQSIPYTQDFSGLPHTSTTYPSGWQGWTISTSPGNNFNTAAPTADRSLIANSSASTTSGNVHNYNGKIGFLNSSSLDLSLALAINTTGKYNIEVNYDIMTIRNPYDGSSNTRINEATLQYRIGTSGTFTNLSGIEYSNNTTTKTGSGDTEPQNLQNKTIILPSSCDNQSVIQLRWASRQVSGAGSRPSFAVDNLSIISRPQNNDCANATSLGDNVQSPIAGTTTNATLTAGAPNGTCTKADTPTGDVWYLLEDVDTGNNRTVSITVDPDASEDYGIYLYRGTCSVLEFIACEDGGSTGATELLTYTFNPTVNGNESSGNRSLEDLFVRVRQFGSNVGTFMISTLGNALPLTFENITAKVISKTALIEWTTLNEVNTASMEIQHNNGASLLWKSIGKVEAAGFSSGKTEYSFTHETPLKGDNLYRIKQFDQDGTFRYSDVVSAYFGNTHTGLILTPNLVHSSLKISFEEPVENGRVLIYNLDGKLVQSYLLAEGIDVLRVDVSGLTPGQYVVHYQSDNGIETVRFVKE